MKQVGRTAAANRTIGTETDTRVRKTGFTFVLREMQDWECHSTEEEYGSKYFDIFESCTYIYYKMSKSL